MRQIDKIVRQYADEFFTKEMLLSGSEAWDLDAQVWLDDHYPDITDEERSRFSKELDRHHSHCVIQAIEDEMQAKQKETETPVFEGMTKSELLAKINKLLKSMDFLEAKRLLDIYKSLK